MNKILVISTLPPNDAETHSFIFEINAQHTNLLILHTEHYGISHCIGCTHCWLNTHPSSCAVTVAITPESISSSSFPPTLMVEGHIIWIGAARNDRNTFLDAIFHQSGLKPGLTIKSEPASIASST